METERWIRIERVFHAVVERPPRERARFLDDACGGDASLRAEVERLLAFDEETPSFIDVPTADADQRSPSGAEFDPRIGQCAGVYRLLSRIGAGGMGVIYRARRDDDLFSYPVAVKLVRRDAGDDQVLRRFEIERRTLANLNHPNIARLLDGGVTDDGAPYLVMELVDGVPIDTYCDEQRLPVADRLTLFRTVCRAVHYAHQNLVVHRDLKPSNILVDAQGVPKLLDFGIAKVLEPDDADPRRDHTATVSRMLTPDYASPEQIRGEPTSTVTDVYSLGVILYGLLTGRRPHRLTSSRIDDIERAVCDREATKPSVAVASPVPATGWRGDDPNPPTPEGMARLRSSAPAKLRRQLRGDLDNIVMMALRKEAARRYASAEQFAADIDRYLGGLPILARRDTMVYRGLKFVRRNRIAVAAAALIFVALAASAVVSASLARVAARDRDAAQEARTQTERQAEHARIESDSANEVARILGDAFLASTTGRDGDEREAVAAALDRELDRVRRQFAARRHLLANLIDSIGHIHLDLQLFDRAESLFDEAHAIRIDEVGPESLEVARSFDSRGELRYHRGDFVGAEAAFRKAIDLHRRHPPDVHTDIALAANNLGVALRSLGRLDEAQTLHEEALALRRRAVPEDAPAVAESLNNLAGIDLGRADYEKAQRHLREALEIRRRVLGENHPLVAQTLSNLALTLHQAGDTAAAEPLFREAVAALRRLGGPEEPGLARTLGSLAGVLRVRGGKEEARALLEESLEIHMRRSGPDHPSVANTLAQLAALDRDAGRTTQARERWIETLRIQRLALPAAHPNIGTSLVGYGGLLTDIGEADTAEPLLREALGIYRVALPADHWFIALAETALGSCLAAQGEYEEARPLVTRGYESLRATRGDAAEETANARTAVRRLYEAWGRPVPAGLLTTPGARREG